MPTPQRSLLSIVPRGPGLTDSDLVAELVAKNPRATVIAWNEHAPRIFRVMERTLGSASDADDATQETFIRVFARIHTLRDPSAFGSFVLSVAMRVLKGHLRYRRVRKILHLVDALPEIGGPALDVEARHGLRRFYALLDELPANERLVFALRHIEGMTLAETAASAAFSLSTTKRLLRRAAARLARKVEKDPALSSYSARMFSDVE